MRKYIHRNASDLKTAGVSKNYSCEYFLNVKKIGHNIVFQHPVALMYLL
jgi:hypothetical protein